MKLELSVPQRPRLIHLVSIVDLLALLFIFPLLISQFVSYGGHEVSLPRSPLRLPAEEHAVVIKVLPGETKPQIWVNQDLISQELLSEKLKQIREEWKHGGDPIAWFTQDENLSLKESTAILNMLFEEEFRVLQVGRYFDSEGR